MSSKTISLLVATVVSIFFLGYSVGHKKSTHTDIEPLNHADNVADEESEVTEVPVAPIPTQGQALTETDGVFRVGDCLANPYYATDQDVQEPWENNVKPAYLEIRKIKVIGIVKVLTTVYRWRDRDNEYHLIYEDFPSNKKYMKDHIKVGCPE